MDVIERWVGVFGLCWACNQATVVRAYDDDTLLCQRCTANVKLFGRLWLGR